MLHYVFRRLLGAIPTLFIIVAVSFFMVRMAPGGPFDKERKVPAEVEAKLIEQYHLDEPLPQQFLRYLGGLAQGDFGPSFKYKDFTVSELIWQGFPTSLALGLSAIGIAVLIGVTLGILAALRQNSWIDYLGVGTAMLGIAVPNFVVAPIMTLVFGLMLHLVPVGGWGKPSNWILPIIALAIPQIAAFTRLTRASMLEVLRSNFVRTARAKGLPEMVTLTRHAIRAALMPVVSYMGPAIANIVTGSVIVEQIFGIPGIGRYFVQGAINRDYTLVLGVTILFGALVILCNLLADICYGLLDPKVRYD
ncbi:MAG: oligopeptide ABC transporter permease OppB [Rhodospirillaceae bacterium]|nr:oligopeptide ABC transporter permease OppB [Rhodospirillaceae bacterium]